MNISKAKEEIIKAVRAYTAKTPEGTYRLKSVRQRPLLIMGPPGLGKTAVMEQAARELDIGFAAYTMTHHTRQSAVGLPVLEERTYGGERHTVTSYTMSEIIASVYDEMESTGLGEGILFLDEINCVSETLMPALLQFLQYKSFGGHTLPEGWVIAAAGNPVRYNRFARELDPVVLDRVRLIEVEPDIAAFRAYASERALHPAVMSFLESREEYFYVEEGHGHGIVTARSWEDLSEVLYLMENEGIGVDDALFGQYIQYRDAAESFAGYYRLYRKWNGRVSVSALPSEEETEGAPYEDVVMLIWILVNQVEDLGRRAQEQKSFAESLGWFCDGLKGKGDPEAALADRRRAIEVKKKYGLLAPGEEEKERKIESAVRECGLEDMQRGDLTALEMLAGSGLEKAEALEERLIKSLGICADFVEERFGKGMELYIYYSAVMDHSVCRRAMEKGNPKLYARACGILDADGREEALKRRLKAQ